MCTAEASAVLVEALAVDPGIEVAGYVSDPTPYLTDADVFIVPVLTGSGMRVKILDAWLWGLPIVSTTGGAAAEKVLTTWARQNRFAGSKDRAALRDLVYEAVRRWRSYAWLGGGETGRARVLGLCRARGLDPGEVFSGERYAPAPLSAEEAGAGQPLEAAPEAVRRWMDGLVRSARVAPRVLAPLLDAALDPDPPESRGEPRMGDRATLDLDDAVLVHPLVYLRLGGDRENHERAGREALQNPESGCPLHLSSSHWHERPASVGMQTLGIAPRPF